MITLRFQNKFLTPLFFLLLVLYVGTMDTKYDFENYFEHKTLTKVYGEPTTKSLQKLFKELKRNARSITSTLGGGQYGHLFMILTEDEWNNLPGTTPVIPPEDPGPLVLGGRLTASEIAMHQKNHDDAKKRYNHFQALKRVLRNQLISAIDTEYLDPIRCDLTDMINQEITEIITFLQDSYGKMTVNQIEEAITTIKNFQYDPSKSINVLLMAIQDHADLLKIAGAKLSDSQIQSLAYYLISKFQVFKDALVAWNKLPEPKTWNTMKSHMRQEYQMLKNINALSIQEAAFNTSNVINELKSHQENLLHSAEQRFKTGLTEVMNMAINDMDDKKPIDTIDNINNIAEINSLKAEIKKLTSQIHHTNNNTFQSNSGGQAFGQYRGNKFNSRYRNNTQKRQYYCWTHGAGHSGWHCKNPAEGHQPGATFSNRMGGNNFGCYTTKPRRFNNQHRNPLQNTNSQNNPSPQI